MDPRGHLSRGGRRSPGALACGSSRTELFARGRGQKRCLLKGDTGAALRIGDRANTRCGAWGYIWEVGC